MRSAFINTLYEQAEKDDSIMLLTADMGFSVFEKFRDRFPDRFYNIGIAEQNMIGIAAGMALSGKKVFVYSIMPFVTMRCYEQIKIDICYHKLNVKIVGVGGGVAYGSQGATHHANEDIGIMRSLPEMMVLCPSDPYETKEIIKSTLHTDGPAFIRLYKNNEPNLYNDRSEFSLGKGYIAKYGNDISIISTGNMVETAIKTAEILLTKGITARVVSLHSIKPIDKEIIIRCAFETKAIFTMEEHSIIGGLGSAVSEVLNEETENKVIFKRFGFPDTFIRFVGDQQFIRSKLGLEANQMAESIMLLLKK